MTQQIVALIALLTLTSSQILAQDARDSYDWFTPEHADAQLLLLGTFHFKDMNWSGDAVQFGRLSIPGPPPS